MKTFTSLLALAAALGFAQADGGDYTYLESSATLAPPADWDLLPGSVCGGLSQSPIALNKNTAATCNKPSFTFNGGNCKVGNIKVSTNVGNWGDVSFENCQVASLQYGTKTYELLALHLHSKAEHAVGADEVLPSAELHLVHVNTQDPADLLVIGVFLQKECSGLLCILDNLLINLLGFPLFSSLQCDTAVQVIFDKLEAANGGSAFSGNNNAGLNVYNLIPPNGYYTYQGSLTTPPCSEIVTWIVAQQAVGITPAQLNQYRSGLAGVEGSLVSAQGNNNRPLQLLNGRQVQACSTF